MCGISGYYTRKELSEVDILKKMVGVLHHRGPDDKGIEEYIVEDYVLGFGQARLSIIDLSQAGHQPMTYKHLSIVFNGEIYNHLEIKELLKIQGHSFLSNSDTEVILHAFDEWGFNCVHRFIGMFAFSIYNRKSKEVVFFRDRAGVKPLYYYHTEDTFLFSSELKSFHEHPLFDKKIDEQGMRLYFEFGYIASPKTIFKNCFKLEPGHFLILSTESNTIKKERYWDINEFYKRPKLKIGYMEAKEELHSILKSAFNYRMVADVPVGVFLSGGYDSSAVTAIIQSTSPQQLRTFTIGFSEGNDEAPYAKETAKLLGTHHKEYYFTTKEAQDLIPQLPTLYDEPFFDSSALPTIMVSKFAQKDVSVVLSADGGDEIFAGYDRYVENYMRLKKLNKLPKGLKKGISFGVKRIHQYLPDEYISFKHKIQGLFESLKHDGLAQSSMLYQYSHMLPQYYSHRLFTSEIEMPSHGFSFNGVVYSDPLEQMMATDFKNYLPDDIMTKVDRATMSVSIEGREPFLDQRIIEFAAQLPIEYKFDGFETKKILKDIVHEYLPEEVMKRPKKGFTIPIYHWLKGDLSYLIDDYLSKESIEMSGLFETDFVLNLVCSFRKGELHYQTIIWKLLMFQMWYAKWMK